MEFRVYDSLTRKKQPLFGPDNTDEDGSRHLGLYVCGPTVYQRIHIGNARPFIMFGMFVRYLRAIGVKVTYVSNITDINDKIYRAAREQNLSSEELARRATEWYIEDTNRLGIGRPDIEPRASDSIADMIALIEELISRKLAYETGGSVYFSVDGFKQYGRLSNQDPAEMQGTGRIESDPGKKAALDFALWKATKKDEDTAWDSPWGRGRPGWHIECSAMAERHLGEQFDVHGGGIDLIFPHHENEFAQSRGAKRKFARLWMHNGLLETDGQKMAKSDGNIQTLQDVLDRWPTHVLFLYFFGASYRSPIDWGDEQLHEARARGERITEALRRARHYLSSVEVRDPSDTGHADSKPNWVGIHEALHDDFNTSNAMGEVFGLIHDLNTAVSERATPQLVRNVVATLEEFLKLFRMEALIPSEEAEAPAEVAALVQQREAARAAKEFDQADALREKIAELGWDVHDTPDGIDLRPRAGSRG